VASALSMKLAEKRLLQLLMNNPDLQNEILPLCTKHDFEGLASERIFSILIDGFGRNQTATYENLHRQLAGEAEQALLAQLEIEEVPEIPSRDTAESALNALRTMRLTAYRQEILNKITEASESNDEKLLNQLIEERVLVDRELVGLAKK
jgi:hypothetical protein